MRKAGQRQFIFEWSFELPGGGNEILVDLIMFFSMFYTCYQQILSEGLKLHILETKQVPTVVKKVKIILVEKVCYPSNLTI